jgi:cytochrome c biogenesis protein CcmG/thiol:disulfide interchange protein DsbE
MSATPDRSSSWLKTMLLDTRRWAVLLVGVVVLGSIWIYLSRVPEPLPGSTAPPSPQIGFSAPDFTLDDLNGKPITLSDLRGKVVVINLWASWCAPCRAEMPAIDTVYRKYQARDLVVLGVNTTFQDTESDARAFVQNLGVTFPLLFDRDGLTSKRYRLQAMPTTFFVGRDGVIRDIVFGGPMSEALIASKVEKLLAENK